MDARRLLDLSRDVTGTLDLQEVLERSLAGLTGLADLDGGAILLVEDGELCVAAAVPALDPSLAVERIAVGAGLSGRIAADGEPLYVPDLEARDDLDERSLARLRGGVRSWLGAPLIMSGRPLGVVQIESRRVDAFDERTRERVLSFVPTIAAAVVQSRAFGRQQSALDQVRMASDAITQGLAVAKYALDRGQDDEARAAIEESLRRSRAVITELLGEGPPPPGSLRRAG